MQSVLLPAKQLCVLPKDVLLIHYRPIHSPMKQEGAAVEGPPAMGPSLQLSTDRRRERPLPWQRGHSGQGGKGSLRHMPNIKLIGQQAAKLWGFFANNAISRRDLDLWPIDLVIGPGVLVSQGPFLPSFVYVGLFVFPLGGGTLAFGYGRPTPATAGILEIGPRGCWCPRDPICFFRQFSGKSYHLAKYMRYRR